MTLGRARTASALLLFAMASGCGNATTAPQGTGGGTHDRIDVDTIVGSTVRVRAHGCGPRTDLGTGTSIEGGLIVTAAHVVAGSARTEVVTDNGAPITADVVFFDADLDVAALRPSVAAATTAPLRAEPAEPGDRGVVALVADDGSIEVVDVDVVRRVTIVTTDIYRDAEVRRSGLHLEVDLDRGDSGAMVHLDGGGVGIVWSRSTATTGRAWTVDLPVELTKASARSALLEPVDTGPCP